MLSQKGDQAIGGITEKLVLNFQEGQGFLSCPQCPDWLWDPLSLLFNGYWELLPGDKALGTNN
jgi:hypothetical protein